MRKETDEFLGLFECKALAFRSERFGNGIDMFSGLIVIDADEVILTKQQARKFAKQILEMTGDEDE